MANVSRRRFVQLILGAAGAGWLQQRAAPLAASSATLADRSLSSQAELPAGVPVFMYHASQFGGLSESEFRHQMRVLKELRYRTITFRALRHYVENGSVPRGCVVLTFDDVANWTQGQYREPGKGPFTDFWRYTFPAMAQYGFSAVLGVVTGGMPEEGEGWDWKKLRFIQSLGYELASHSVTHNYHLAGRSGFPPDDEVVAELAGSREAIARGAGVTPIAYVWPFGVSRWAEQGARYYPVLVEESESGPVRRKEQLLAVPRYHPDLHAGEDYLNLMTQYAERRAGRALLAMKERFLMRRSQTP